MEVFSGGVRPNCVSHTQKREEDDDEYASMVPTKEVMLVEGGRNANESVEERM